MKEHCVPKIFCAIWETFLYENNCNFNYYRFSYKLALIHFFFLRMKQKRKSIFEEVDALVTKNFLTRYSCLFIVLCYISANCITCCCVCVSVCLFVQACVKVCYNLECHGVNSTFQIQYYPTDTSLYLNIFCIRSNLPKFRWHHMANWR